MQVDVRTRWRGAYRGSSGEGRKRSVGSNRPWEHFAVFAKNGFVDSLEESLYSSWTLLGLGDIAQYVPANDENE